MYKRVRLSLVGIASCLVIAAFWGIHVLPDAAVAKRPVSPLPTIVEVIPGDDWQMNSLDAEVFGTGEHPNSAELQDFLNGSARDIRISYASGISFNVTSTDPDIGEGAFFISGVADDLTGAFGLSFRSTIQGEKFGKYRTHTHFEDAIYHPVVGNVDGIYLGSELIGVKLHVHAENVPVFRSEVKFKIKDAPLDGTVSIGDIIFWLPGHEPLNGPGT